MRAHKFVLSLALVAVALFTSSSLRSASFVGTIAGTVTDSGATPLVGVNVSAYNPSGTWMGSDVTTAGGAYDIPGLAAGTYFVRTSNNLGYVDEVWDDVECVSCNLQSTGAPVIVADGLTTTVDFALAQGGTISGTVLGEGLPLVSGGGTFITVTIVDAGNTFVTSASTIAGGAYTTPALPAGTYFARVSTNLGFINEIWNNVQCQFSCQLTSAAAIAVTAGANTPGIAFDLQQGARFSGTVENASAVPLSGVVIEVRNTANQSVASATTAADGTFTTSPGIPAGDYILRTSNAPSYINETNDGLPCIGFCDIDGRTPVTAAAGVITSGVDFVLDAGGSISGTVTNALAAPLANVSVNILSSTGLTITSGFTNASGVYTSRDGLLPGSYYVTTSNGIGYINQLHPAIPCLPSCTVALGTPVNVAGTSAVGGINFTLAAGARITGHVTEAVSGADLSGVTVSVINAAGTTFSTGFTDANGIYTTSTGLPTGSYYLRTGNSRGLINEVYPDIVCQGTLCPSPVGVGVPVSVTGGVLPFVPVVVDMDLAEGGRISGTVEDGTSAAVVGASVQILSLTGQSVGSSTTDGLGNYISGAGLPGGDYYVRTSNSLGYIDELYDNVVCGTSCSLGAGSVVTVSAGAETSGVDFQLALGGTISGTVMSGGTPLGNLSVQIVNAATNTSTTDVTDASGNFSVKGLVDGTYYARTSNAQGYINEVYNNLQCPLNCFNILGAPLVISGANTESGVNFDLEAGGRVSGVIIDDATTLPIAGISVQIVDPSGLTASNGTTNGLGEYISGTGLAPGTYYVRTSNSLGYVNELYNNIPCATGCALATGAVVTVSAGATTAGINFGLSAGGRAAGQVTDAGTGNPIQGVQVGIYDAAGRQVGSSSTDSSGNFVTGAGLSTGTYYARTSNSQGYLDEVYNNKPCVGSCSVLTGDSFSVTVGLTTSGVNFSLAHGGRISGTIVDAGTFLPITGASVQVYDSTGRFVTSGGTNSFGVYTTSQGLATGTYYLRTGNGQGHINELFGGALCVGNCVVTTGVPVAVTSPGTTSGVDFQLGAGGRISGTITEAGSGDPVANVAVTIYNSAGLPVSGGSSNALGIFRTTAGLPTDTYTARTFNGQGLINQLHSGSTCLGTCDVLLGTPIGVTAGSETSGINFVMTPGARVQGIITTGGNPVPGALGAIYDSVNVRVAAGVADGSGTFVTSEGLPAGTYYARSENSVGLVNQVHAGIDCTVACNPTAGTGIVLGGAGITSGINFSLTPDADGDGDGIVNTIDLQPAVSSDDFSDVAQGGTSDGTILGRFGTILVGDVSPSGIQVDLPTAGGSPATFDVCALNGAQRILLDASGESAVYSCNATTGSTSVRALNALPIVELRDPATGPGIIIQLGSGQGATTGSPVTADPTNTDTILVIIVDGTGTEIGSFELDAGESAQVVVNPDGSADAEVIEGVVEITVRGESVVLEPGETHDFPPPVAPNYTFTGFFSPVSNLPAVHSANSGSAIPVKFSLNGFQGLDVIEPGYPMSQPMSCTTWAPIGPAVAISSNGGLTYDANSDRYSIVWKTVKGWSNSCRQFQMLLDDGTTHRFNVKFKK